MALLTLPSFPAPEQFKKIAEQYDVEIIRDEFGVPHIYGKRDADAAFGLAYAHAEDDFATIQDVILATRWQDSRGKRLPGCDNRLSRKLYGHC